MRYLAACVLTVLIETPLFFAAGWRRHDDLTIIVCANAVTNLAANLCIAYLFPPRWNVIMTVESVIVAAEYTVYALAFGRSKRLFLLTLLANCLSFGAGLLLF